MNENRVVVLIDMDCFYVQVEQRRNPHIRGKACAVVQYNNWKGGGIIAVGYEARAMGVTRNMRGDEAQQKCPDIVLCRVPTANGKADLTRYREASAEVINVLLQFGGLVERASIDEAYIDLTAYIDQQLNNMNEDADLKPTLEQLGNTHVVGYPSEDCSDQADARQMGVREYLSQAEEKSTSDLRLAMAAVLVERIRTSVFHQTSFRCSAGVSCNKMLAKLACGINKPNKQTILPISKIDGLFKNIKIGKIRNLGGKLGQTLSKNLGIEKIGQLTEYSMKFLKEKYGDKTGQWLYEVCRGMDREAVKERHMAQSVGCSKNFTGAAALDTKTKVKYWLECLATELVERLNKEKDANNRMARGMTAHVTLHGGKHVSRVCALERYDVQQVARDCFVTLQQLNASRDKPDDVWSPAIVQMGMSSKNFTSITGGVDVSTMLCKNSAKTSPRVASTKSITSSFHATKSEESSSLAATESTNSQSLSTTKSKESPSGPSIAEKLASAAAASSATSTSASSPRGSPARNTPQRASPAGKTSSESCEWGSPVRKKRRSEELRDFLTTRSALTPTPPSPVDSPPDPSPRHPSPRHPSPRHPFFAALEAESSQESPPGGVCLIDERIRREREAEAARLRAQSSEAAGRSDVIRDVTTGVYVDVAMCQAMMSSGRHKKSISSPAKKLTKDSVVEMLKNNPDIDKEVFNSLPPLIQQEIVSSMSRNSTTGSAASSSGHGSPNKQRSAASSSGKESPSKQRSITGFLSSEARPTFTPSTKLHQTSTKPRPISTGKKDVAKTKKDKKIFAPIEANKMKQPEGKVPLGFFRARVRTSVAIRQAVENRPRKKQPTTSAAAAADHQVDLT